MKCSVRLNVAIHRSKNWYATSNLSAQHIWIQTALTAYKCVWWPCVLGPGAWAFSSTEKHHTELAATCQQHCYLFSLRNIKKTVHDCKSEVWIIGEWCDPIPGRFVELTEEIIAFIWNGHSAFIWVNGAEGEIFSRSLTLCQSVEKRWLPENKNSCEANPS